MAWTQPPIHDLALVGDCRSAALVDRRGDVVWLCWPRMDSDALFASLLDGERRGHWRLRPEPGAGAGGGWRVERRYIPDTNVLQTSFLREDAEVVLTDCMTVADESDQRRLPLPEHELLRRVECIRGEATVEHELVLAPTFGRKKARVHAHPTLGLCCEAPAGAFLFRGEVPFSETPAPGTFGGRFTLRAGESRRFSLTYSAEAPAVLSPLGDASDDAIRRTLRWWRAWAAKCTYRGPYRDAVIRSALALKLLCYAPSGAIVAAATCSLPERVGGSLNWDYRYCWIRDAAFTCRALYDLGYADEAGSFIEWLLHITRLSQPRLRVMFDVYGNPSPRERVLEGARGYRDSRPVRVGNGAVLQRQMDLHGELVDAIYAHCRRGGELDRDTEVLLAELGRYVVKSWHLPDQGIWELRGPARPYTHSRVLCWTALDRLIELHRLGHLHRVKLDVGALARAREEIRRSVLEEGYDPGTDSYVEHLGGHDPDAALLLLPWYAFERADSPRIRGTFRRVVHELSAPNGLLFRNPALREAGDGGFVACGFWAAELLADGGGPLPLARAWFEQLLRCCNDVGLMSEEMDPETGEAIGNFPQAYSHVGLISVALALEARARRERGRPIPAVVAEEAAP
ncbi:MAG TPA: glycoside hydrolase family 15 protein [Myxococcaceae bacterium]|nr:glycoside hydrolase family 15 protein [Myxococcaceae bacterium]